MAYYPDFIPDPETCERYPYGRFPYIRITLDDGSTVDGKASAWQGDRFLAVWVDAHRQVHQLWMDNKHATRIPRKESSWHESPSADDIAWRVEMGEY